MSEESTGTTMATELEAKTQSAIKDVGLDIKEFDAEVDAILAKKPAEKAPEQAAEKVAEKPPEPAKPKQADTPKPVVVKDFASIPPELLGEPKKPDTKPDEEREKFIKEQTKDMSVKAADRFKALEKAKHEAEERARKAIDLERDLTSARERIKQFETDPEKIELKKRLDEMDEVVKKQALVEHPKFKAHFDTPIAEYRESAVKLIGAEEGKEVAELLRLPESKNRNARLNELAKNLEGIELQKFANAVDQVDRLTANREKELADWKTNAKRLDEITEQERQTISDRNKRILDSAFDGTMAKVSNPKDGLEVFRKVDGNEDWNREVDERVSAVRELINRTLSPNDIAEMAALTVSNGKYRQLFLMQNALVGKLQEELNSLRVAEPGLGSGGAAKVEMDDNADLVSSLVGLAVKEGAIR